MAYTSSLFTGLFFSVLILVLSLIICCCGLFFAIGMTQLIIKLCSINCQKAATCNCVNSYITQAAVEEIIGM